MIRINLASIFFLLATLCYFSFTSPLKPRDFAGLEADMNQLAADVTTLANSIKSVGNGIVLVSEAVSD